MKCYCGGTIIRFFMIDSWGKFCLRCRCFSSDGDNIDQLTLESEPGWVSTRR